jgi:hypothetical protein
MAFNFQTGIVILLIIILIISLTVIGLTLKKGATTNERIIPTCPDFFTLSPSGECIDVRDIAKCPGNITDKHLTMDFNKSPFTGSDALCQKYTWATKCGVAWENLTYGVDKSPCDTS